ncbi:MAG: 5'/3'-nucleotidase SurE [Cytophagales bacterium]|nr:5'/3'-nucleotidase SurE [Cytophagales bacterium]
MNRPKILVTNDDGITSNGIRLLIEIAKNYGDVVVVAPNKPQSAMGHAITIGHVLRLEPVDLYDGVEAYECSGTPADCVKLAKHHVLKGEAPDLVLSGINHGSNTSVSVLYSGTISAAIEAAIEGHPSIGFSLCDYDHSADLSHIEPYIHQIIKEALDKKIQKGLTLNVNFPPKQEEEIKGIRICRQAKARWLEKFDERHDPMGKRYFWMSGEFENFDHAEDSDEWAVQNNYVSIVPCQYDMTAHHYLAELNTTWNL